MIIQFDRITLTRRSNPSVSNSMDPGDIDSVPNDSMPIDLPPFYRLCPLSFYLCNKQY